MSSVSVIKVWVGNVIWLLFAIGCSQPESEYSALDFSIHVNDIPNDTVASVNTNLKFVNGKYLLNDKPFSGIVYKVLKGFPVSTYSSVLKGQLHGIYRSFYSSGKPYEVRAYRRGLSVGKHVGYWDDTGILKFEYNYHDQKKEGAQKNWYSNGQPAYVYSYRDDRLDGLQQAWRINGSLYRNFVVKNGVRYGLQKSEACYEVKDERIVLQSSKKPRN